MFYLNYDIAKLLVEERRAMADRYRRRAPKDVFVPSPSVDERTEADVIELVFGAHCEHDQIGA